MADINVDVVVIDAGLVELDVVAELLCRLPTRSRRGCR